MLRVGIDGRAFSSPAAGVRRYVHQLAGAMPAAGIEWCAIGGDRAALPEGVAHVSEARHPPTNLGWTLVGVPRTARRVDVALYHAPAYTAPLAGIAPRVVTIHDVSYARHPEWYPWRRDPVRRLFYRLSAQRADVIITDSAFSAREITAAYGIDPARLAVVPLAPAAQFQPSGAAFDAGGVPYVVHVGDLHVRRDLGVALEAVLMLRARVSSLARLRLICAGVDRGVGARLVARAEAARQPDALTLAGTRTDAEIAALYRGARALVYPSRYEGFGLPVVEAMASGTPVVAADAASLPEVVGHAGVLVPAGDAQAFAAALQPLLTDQSHWAAMRARGLARAAELTWENAARLTADVYRDVAARHRRVGRPAPPGQQR